MHHFRAVEVIGCRKLRNQIHSLPLFYISSQTDWSTMILMLIQKEYGVATQQVNNR